MAKSIHIAEKRVANWLGDPKRVMQQILVSIWSYITFPLVNYRDDATKEYFQKIYDGQNDPLLFDGKDDRYLQQIELVMNLQSLNNRNVLDIGCGNGNLFHWLTKKCVHPIKYLGIDFAHPDEELAENACIVQEDVQFFNVKRGTNQTTIFIINTLCYLNDQATANIFNSSSKGSEITIVEPLQSIFWDAYFDGVHLYYKKPSQIINMLHNSHWRLEKISMDYAFYIMGAYLFPLTYCISAKKH